MSFKRTKIDIEDSKFRLRSGKYFLTFTGEHLDKDMLMEHYDAVFTGNRFIRVAHHTIPDMTIDILEQVIKNEEVLNGILEELEEGTEKFDFLNTYLLVDATRTGLDATDHSVLLYEEAKYPIVFEKLVNKNSLDEAKLFFSKIDKENSDLAPPKPLYERVAECKTLKEALIKFAIEAKDVGGIITMFNQTRRDNNVACLDGYEPTYPWQIKFIKVILKSGREFRKIVWYYDPIGNSGKTMLGQWLSVTYPHGWRTHNDMGTSRDASTIIANDLNNGWEAEGVCINFTRGAENRKAIYQYLESLKDGQITAVKYSGGTSLFKRPKVIVFSNWLPNTSHMSSDRWDVKMINEDKDVVDLPFYKVVEMYRTEHQRLQEQEINGYDSHDFHEHTNSIKNALGKVRSPENRPIFSGVEKVIKIRTPVKTPVRNSDPSVGSEFKTTTPVGEIDSTLI